MFPQSDAMEVRMRASEAVAAQQVQQGREIAARFSEQSAKNQHDSRRDDHFEQRLMLQVRPHPSPLLLVLVSQQVGLFRSMQWTLRLHWWYPCLCGPYVLDLPCVLCFQERHVQNQADANTKLQEQVLELTRQLAREGFCNPPALIDWSAECRTSVSIVDAC